MLAILIVAVALVAILKSGLLNIFLGSRKSGDPNNWPVYAKRVLTPNEQKCYHRLHAAFPNHIVLAQVSVSQLLGIKKGHGANYRAVFNRFRQLTADFVICNNDFSIAAVFELDDASHDRPTRQDSDARKSAALAAANIPLHRLNSARLPDEVDLRTLQSDLSAAASSQNV
jgi:hypothetical protein